MKKEREGERESVRERRRDGETERRRDGGTGRRRDGETMRRRDRETERRGDGETERRRDGETERQKYKKRERGKKIIRTLQKNVDRWARRAFFTLCFFLRSFYQLSKAVSVFLSSLISVLEKMSLRRFHPRRWISSERRDRGFRVARVVETKKKVR